MTAITGGKKGLAVDFLANIAINLLFFSMLAILFANAYHNHTPLMFDQRLFLFLLVSNAMMLVFDTMQWALDGVPGGFSHNLNLLFNAFYYIVHAIPSVLWCLYVRYQVLMNEQRAMRAVTPLAALIGLNALLSVASLWTGWYFYLDKANVYHRGGLFWLFAAITFGCVFYAQFYILANRKKLENVRYYSLLLFMLPPFLGGLLQVFFYGISLIWPCVSLSLLMLYINIQNNQLYTDYLTGLHNRRLLDQYLDGYLKKAAPKEHIGCIMMDLNRFKTINDLHGHPTGDRALVDAANILKKSIGKNGFLARYGGDEFVAIVEVEELPDLERTIDSIRQSVSQYNQRRSAPYLIEFSFGYDMFACGSGLTKEQVLHRIDSLMYENKQSYKLQREV